MSRYRAGVAREYRAMRILEQAGYTTLRTAGSHGIVDVIAVRRGDVRFIQVKSGKARLSGVERERLELFAKDALGCYQVECWSFYPRKREPSIEIY